jgi:COMPASS component SWD3
MSHFEFAYNGLDYFVAAISKSVGIYQIDPKSGEVNEVQKTEGDFHEKEPEVAKSKWSRDNKLIVTGGEDGIMRVYKVIFSDTNLISGFELSDELGAHSQGITDVCINQDSSIVVSASVDKTLRIYSLKDKHCIKKLAFSEGIGSENLQFKGVVFSPDSRFIYSLATRFKGRSYLIKWDAKSDNFDPIDTTPAHHGPSCTMNITEDGRKIAIGTNDGHVVGIDANSMSVYRSEKKHRMPISNISFSQDSGSILTVSSDYTYQITSNTSQSSFCGKLIKL